jgi:leader peptidase (prepilin peptidase)/N-methyltransferase
VTVIALAAVSFAKFESIGQALVGAIFCGALAVITAIDLERRVIPNRIVLPAGAVVLVGNVLQDPDRAWEYAGAAGAALAIAAVLSIVTRGGLGMGDAKLCFLLGAGLGWNVLGAVVVASLAAFVAAVVVLLRRGLGARKDTIPFGPFLALGGIVALFFS